MDYHLFESASRTLYDHWTQLSSNSAQAGLDWTDMALKPYQDTCDSNRVYLRITRKLPIPLRIQPRAGFPKQTSSWTPSSESNNQPPDTEDLESSDEEALPKHTSPASPAPPSVIHDIVHSPTWNVPVLYFHCAHLPRGVAPSPDTIYECVVPDACKRPLATPGLSPMGSLSLTEHPVSARPVYWVHPCRTREAMAQVLGGKAADEAGAVGWLMAWFGLIGAHVGLTLPVELVRVLEI